MKNIFFCIVILFFNLTYGQNIDFSGKIIDSTDQYPIFLGDILLNNKLLTVSDDLGRYNFTLKSPNLNDSICIYHISYGKSYYLLSDFIKNNEIVLTTNVNMLEEVIIGKGLDKMNLILKKARKNYKKTRNTSHHWSSINLKQTVYLKQIAQNYLEVNGHAFMVGNRDKDIFRIGFIIPSEVRRTKESEISQKIYRKNCNKGTLFCNTTQEWASVFFNYKVFEVEHPLHKKGFRDKFLWEFGGTEWINNKEYYVLEYKQLKVRNLSNMYGKIWIDKKEYLIFKEMTSFGFYNGSTNFMVFYKQINGTIYPQKIINNMFKHGYSNLNIKSIYSFDDIDTVKRKNYSMGNGFQFMGNTFTKIEYNESYWKNFKLKNNPFKKEIEHLLNNNNIDTIFKQGYHSVLPNSFYFHNETYLYPKFEYLMKKDLGLKE